MLQSTRGSIHSPRCDLPRANLICKRSLRDLTRKIPKGDTVKDTLGPDFEPGRHRFGNNCKWNFEIGTIDAPGGGYRRVRGSLYIERRRECLLFAFDRSPFEVVAVGDFDFDFAFRNLRDSNLCGDWRCHLESQGVVKRMCFRGFFTPLDMSGLHQRASIFFGPWAEGMGHGLGLSCPIEMIINSIKNRVLKEKSEELMNIHRPSEISQERVARKHQARININRKTESVSMLPGAGFEREPIVIILAIPISSAYLPALWKKTQTREFRFEGVISFKLPSSGYKLPPLIGINIASMKHAEFTPFGNHNVLVANGKEAERKFRRRNV